MTQIRWGRDRLCFNRAFSIPIYRKRLKSKKYFQRKGNRFESNEKFRIFVRIMEKERIILFDLDGTLTRGDTFTGFMRHQYGNLGLLRILLRSSLAIAKWKLGFESNIYAKKKMWAEGFRGASEEEYLRGCASYSDTITKMARPEVLEALREEKQRGSRVIIVSASMEDWILPWAEREGVDAVVATRAERCAKGTLTGAFASPNCEKAEKLRRLFKFMPELEKERNRFHVEAYGDSAGDEEMLNFADVAHRI